ncbi:ABC transporter substrate-binding protein [Corynebacterium coyleae]|uniref:ABC transporter substrate-binding protein n=1 Tax=Corynebacterium coyleae TaxID=53374 RepID=UPI0012B950F2|nr:ABC transporter substrate-binding protein [Corynebacterium coyleae]MDK8800591.1 ABC transporter substrate-binding protein [Corynebacterium coyleae]
MSVAEPRRVRFFAAIIAMSLALVFVLVGCADGQESNGDSAAEEKKDASSIRVVALDWRYEEILYALGVKPVGIVEIGKSAAPKTLEGKLDGITSVGQAKQPNLEVIQSLEPDLILASPTRQASIMDQLKEIAPTEAYGDTSYTEVLDAMDDIATKIGAEDKAAEVRARIEDKVVKAKEKVAPGTRAALVGWSKNTLYTWVKDSFAGSLLTAAGYEYGYDGEKSAIESKTDVAELTGDKLPGMKLDVMYLYNDIEGFRSSPYADVVSNIVDVDQDTWSRSRGPLAAEAMLDQIINS